RASAVFMKDGNRVLRLPQLELECMKVLWELGQANVHAIRARMWATRPLAYTTITTVMERLARKGVVERRKEGRSYIYRPLVSDGDARAYAVGRLLDDFFAGSQESLRQYLDLKGIEKGELATSPFAVKSPDAARGPEREAQTEPEATESIDP